ncbi:hypothetical protein H2200_006097 [Cladophialophora chaetospira]|uniref:Uncharacterized protein n=1 Tax=Cladophialophora chaetospira TaxID=386627 RepID=A0AA38XAB0_9EURO|nr:hypothetical protein H2200_006097 [Cladophialophora chaetospira]
MSWMDSWSRPGKHAAVPPPFYLTQGEDVPYCRTCGRVISSRKQHQKSASTIRYCSDRCRNRKPGPIDKKIEKAIAALLNDEPESGIEKTAAKSKLTKGDRRITVTCDEIEEIVFGSRHDPNKTFGRRKNRASRAIGGDGEWKSVDMEDDPDTGSDHDAEVDHQQVRPLVRPSQVESDVNGSIGGEKGRAERQTETPEELEKRIEGQQRAEEREMVRRAARRGVVFGFVVEPPDGGRQKQSASRTSATRQADADTDKHSSEQRRKCEALMNGAVVEPSFAKGNWAVRWRE